MEILIKSRFRQWFRLLLLATFILGCQHKKPEPNFYENLYTGMYLDKQEFENYVKKLHLDYSNSTNGKAKIYFHFYRQRLSSDSIIQPFKYDVKVGKEYIVREDIPEKIDMWVAPKIFLTLNGDSIVIGGIQDKPTLINLWFVECPGCIQEMPELNKLREKYIDKMNFIAMTFESKKKVEKFLNKRQFDFVHITDVEEFIKYIGTKPYPENIFIDKQGHIKYIEGGVRTIQQFEDIIDELISSN
jgi:thiol-disulfide isomerase/thioredoxin